ALDRGGRRFRNGARGPSPAPRGPTVRAAPAARRRATRDGSGDGPPVCRMPGSHGAAPNLRAESRSASLLRRRGGRWAWLLAVSLQPLARMGEDLRDFKELQVWQKARGQEDAQQLHPEAELTANR